MIDGWRYYNHAMVATGAPGKEVDLEPIKNGRIWRDGKFVLFARWTSDYDCDQPTQWWYCLKDDAYDIQLTNLNSKKRYRIIRARKNFDIKIVNESETIEQLINVEKKAFAEYPKKYRPKHLNEDNLRNQIQGWNKTAHKCFGAYKTGTEELCGFSLVNEYEEYGGFVQQKVDPACEKDEINAALVDGILRYYANKIQKEYPIVDGQRNVVHETAFQEYLCRYFGFRLAYCRLNIVYRRGVKILVKLLYPLKAWFGRRKGKFFHSVHGVLKMEEICRSFE